MFLSKGILLILTGLNSPSQRLLYEYSFKLPQFVIICYGRHDELILLRAVEELPNGFEICNGQRIPSFPHTLVNVFHAPSLLFLIRNVHFVEVHVVFWQRQVTFQKMFQIRLHNLPKPVHFARGPNRIVEPFQAIWNGHPCSTLTPLFTKASRLYRFWFKVASLLEILLFDWTSRAFRFVYIETRICKLINKWRNGYIESTGGWVCW